jgi:hypothetical protein
MYLLLLLLVAIIHKLDANININDNNYRPYNVPCKNRWC